MARCVSLVTVGVVQTVELIFDIGECFTMSGEFLSQGGKVRNDPFLPLPDTVDTAQSCACCRVCKQVVYMLGQHVDKALACGSQHEDAR
jgi:hypothetical protein